MKKGTRRNLKTNSGQQRINIIGALERGKNKIITQINRFNINARNFLKFIKKIEKKYKKYSEIIIILDNAKIHHAKLVQKYLKDHPYLKFWYLPPYSPNLNLIERLWRFTKSKLVKNHFHENFKLFQQRTRYFFFNIERHKRELKTLLTDSFRIINNY